MNTRRVAMLLALSLLVSAACFGTQIVDVSWDHSLGVMVVSFDVFPSWGDWTMHIDGVEVPMEGGDGKPVVRPNAPLDQNPTSVLVGTASPWPSPLPAGELPCVGTIRFQFGSRDWTNTFSYDVAAEYCEGIGPGTSGSENRVFGEITEDTTWSGDVLVIGSVVVRPNVELVIEPGTRVRFVPYRGYTEPSKRLSMRVEGVLTAIGTAEEPIWFTSASDDPINGDWSMLRLVDASNRSQIRFAILEFAQQGLNVWNTSPTIADVIVRWNNWEGIYFESRCNPTVERARIYENGYNGIAMEQFNDATIRNCLIADNGTHGIHVDASEAHVESSILEGNGAAGLSVDNHGTLYVEACTVRENQNAIQCGEGQNELYLDAMSILFGNTNDTPSCSPNQTFGLLGGLIAPQSLVFPMDDLRPYELGYTPSDRALDRYMYIYPDRDRSREVVNKIGDGLGLTWSVAWDGSTIWTATLWGDVYQLHPESGAVISKLKYPGPQAWGMTFDGEDLWINDFAEKRVYQMSTSGRVLSSFPIPDQTGGAKGITWNGTHLCLMGWTSPTVYVLDRSGAEVERFTLNRDAGGGIAWDGQSFWIPAGGRINSYSATGQYQGHIYACSEGTWDLTWDGTHLWATQRTNENWFDDKLFRIKILEQLR